MVRIIEAETEPAEIVVLPMGYWVHFTRSCAATARRVLKVRTSWSLQQISALYNFVRHG
jgi:hypothetical protein